MDPEKVIVISGDDDVPYSGGGDTPMAGQIVSTAAGGVSPAVSEPEAPAVSLTGSVSSSAGTVKYNVTWQVPGPVTISEPLVLPEGIAALHRFLGQLMRSPPDGFDPMIGGLRTMLRMWLRKLYESIGREYFPLDYPDLRVDFAYIRPDRTFVNSSFFGIADLWVIHQFLGTEIRPTTGGFAGYVAGVRHPLLAHVRTIRDSGDYRFFGLRLKRPDGVGR